MSEIEIRNARPDEVDAVSDLLVASYAQYAPAPGAHRDAAVAWDEYAREVADVRGRSGDGSELIVAADGNRLIGTVTYYAPGSRTDSDWPGEWASIRLLGVHPDARGRGVGRGMTEECLRRARAAGAATMGLNTATVMEVARSMYERMGFVRIPESDLEIAPGVTLFSYRLDL